jgi:hypothetical protein
MNKTKYYHYTTENRIQDILESGKITQATLRLNKKEKPCTWISSNQIWEKTATKMAKNDEGLLIQLTFEQQLACFGCARIEVKPNNLYNWPKLKHIVRIDKVNAKFLEDEGIKRGANPSEWHGSLFPIEMDQWIRIEIFEDGKWIEYTK